MVVTCEVIEFISEVTEVYHRSAPNAMDFHPVRSEFLLVGTHIGEVYLWNLGSRNSISFSFEVWNVKSFPYIELLAFMKKDRCIRVNRIKWNSDGLYFGVAYSQHVIHLYYHHGDFHICRHKEIVSHHGSVNDLEFTWIKDQQMVLTCGDDGIIKGWDLSSGIRLFSFEVDAGEPVYCIRPFVANNAHYILSTSSDGMIRLWTYDTATYEVFHKTGNSSMTICLSTDGDNKRLFSCGKNEDTTLSLVELSKDGGVCRTYEGLTRCASDIIQLDTAQNRFLAAGYDHLLQFWNMNNPKSWMNYTVEGSLPAEPIIRFNKAGSLLAVSTRDNKVKVLAYKIKEKQLNVQNDMLKRKRHK